MKNEDNLIVIPMPDHLIKIDEGKNVSVQKRILIIIGSYINRKNEKKKIKK